MIQRDVSETYYVRAAQVGFPVVTQVLIYLGKQMLIKYVPFQLFILLQGNKWYVFMRLFLKFALLDS